MRCKMLIVGYKRIPDEEIRESVADIIVKVSGLKGEGSRTETQILQAPSHGSPWSSHPWGSPEAWPWKIENPHKITRPAARSNHRID